MINLVSNENMKLAHSASTWVMTAILVIVIVLVGILSRFGNSQATTSNWKADVTIENQFIKQSLDQPETSKTQKDGLSKQLQINEYRLKHDVQPIKDNSL